MMMVLKKTEQELAKIIDNRYKLRTSFGDLVIFFTFAV